VRAAAEVGPNIPGEAADVRARAAMHINR
jgi:hypothetical protein